MTIFKCHCWLILSMLVASAIQAHETDQFTVPPDRQFADLGDYFSRWAYQAIDAGVRQTNAQIREAMKNGSPPGVLAELQSEPHVTMAVRLQWPWSVTQIEKFERVLQSPEMRRRYPGQVVCYGERFAGVYQWAFLPFDIREFAHILFFSSTIKVYGTYLGTDKLGHFTDVGISYYFVYRHARDIGQSEREAVAQAVKIGSEGLMSESGMLGLLANADYANGDISADFAGFLFYRNLTEPTPLKGEIRPPMLVRDGAFWKIADDIRPDSGFFARFVSDHLDEALNPGFFDGYLRPAMHDAVRARTAVLLQHYADERGRPRSREWFDRKWRELNTYWGVDYGHRGTYDELVSIGNSCFDSGPPRFDDSGPAVNVLATGSTARSLGQRTNSRGAGARVERAVELNRRDEFGRTSLHEAARVGTVQMVEALLSAGADISAADDYGTTPLHLACRRGNLAIVETLLGDHADPNAANASGVTPLHEAASNGDLPMIRLLIQAGARTDVRNVRGRTPADVANEHGYFEAAVLLRKGGLP